MYWLIELVDKIN